MASDLVRTRRVDEAILAGSILAISLAASGRVSDTDPYWQVRAGQEVLAGTPMVRPDTWSWAPTGGLFYPNSPAWNVVLGGAWNLAGSWGLFIVAACSVAICLSLIAYLARRLGARALPTVPVIVIVSGAVLPVLSPRPALASQSILLGAIAAAEWWSRRAGRHPVAANFAIVLVAGFAFSLMGNWVHLSWASLSAAAAVAWIVIWLLARGLTRSVRAAMIAAGTLGFAGGTLLGPYGLGVWTRADAVFATCQGIVIEWVGAFTPELGGRWWPLWLVTSVAATVAFAWCVRTLSATGRADARLPLAAALAVCAVPFALAGVVAIRFISTSILTLAPILAAAFTVMVLALAHRLSRGTDSGRLVPRKAAEWTSEGFWRVVLAATLLVLSPLVVVAAWPHAAPATAGINRLLPADCRLFGTSIESASVILTRPDVKVWLDGRSEYWGRERLIRANVYLFHPTSAEIVPRGTTCVLLTDPGLEPGLTVITQRLDDSPQWQHLAGQDGANLWIPAATAPAPLS